MLKFMKCLLLSFGSGKNSAPVAAASKEPKRITSGCEDKYDSSDDTSSSDKFNMDRCFEVGVKSSQRVASELMLALKKENLNQVNSVHRLRMHTKWNSHIEDMLVKDISKHYPDHHFITKNRNRNRDTVALTDDPTWFLDPLGSPKNFAHGFPFANINLAFWLHKKPRFGIIWNPLLDECYTARDGFGSYMNVNPLRVSKCTKLADALVMVESKTRHNLHIEDMPQFRKMAHKVDALRSLGSNSISMCLVAQGYADAYIDYHCTTWDMSAALLIVKEAGGVVYDPSLKPFDVMSHRILCAATQELAEQLGALLKEDAEEEPEDWKEDEEAGETKQTKRARNDSCPKMAFQKFGLKKEAVQKHGLSKLECKDIKADETFRKLGLPKSQKKDDKELRCPKMVYVIPKLTAQFSAPSTSFTGYPKRGSAKQQKSGRNYPTDPILPGQKSMF